MHPCAEHVAPPMPGAADARAELLGSVLDYALKYQARSDDAPFPQMPTSTELRAALGGPLPDAGQDAQATLDALIEHGEPGVMASHSARFFGFVIGGSYPVATAADWLTSVWDQCGALYVTSPVASVAEDVVLGWLTELFGLPARTSAGITSGCSSANLTALAAARHHVFAARGWDVTDRGLFGAPTPRVMVSRGCHVSVLRALSLLGLSGQVRLVDTDEKDRMRLDSLDEALADGDGPLIVCGQVGTIDTGSVDRLAELADRVHAQHGWLHLDAAFGMWAAATPRLCGRVAGLERADSWATDAHKWLNVPYDSGLVFVAHPESHRAALRARAAYLVPGDDAQRDPMDYTPEMARRARSLALWATLRHLGTDGVAELVERCCGLAARLAARLAAEPGVTVLNDVVLNQVLVRFAPDGGTAGDPVDGTAAHTTAVVDGLQSSGVAWASPTVWQDAPALRISVCNWRSDADAVDACADALITLHRAGAGRLRPAGHSGSGIR